ncbi:GNAT family N-acetyltransferase [Paenibacillus pectinilyticus]|uniref:GNAT family N-acetyltransferase n=1 Tax=Paenibacillus pectinilyticus TaxID=512399 RepID=A0A1C1A1S8_9BACL|nr:GNAT family N-acetyltransferase [Paenibacillus pectinilyticus]OCT14485.1 GNAT family N-acetyltransferase [Paenibacillus pectinilyticus]
MFIYKNESITIRQLEASDKSLLVNWLNDPLVLTYYEGRDRPHDEELVEEHFYQVDGAMRCIVAYKDVPIGYIQFYELEEEERFEYGYAGNGEKIFGTDQFIGVPSYWNQGIGKQIVTTMLAYFMHVARADRVVMDPQQWNVRAIRCYERCGFVKVKELPQHEMHEGELRDCWLMSYSRDIEAALITVNEQGIG